MTKCTVCSSDKCLEFISTRDINQGKSEEAFHYFLCHKCRSIFLWPIPDDLSVYYAQDYPAYSIKAKPKDEVLMELLERSKLEIVRRYEQGGHLLEIGPASGRFLKIAADAGYVVSAIEQDIGCVRHIKNTFHIDVVHSNDPAAAIADSVEHFDIVVAWHVLEHLRDPEGFVAAIAKVLRQPNGFVILSAPNPRSLSFKIFRSKWLHLDAPRHLTLIPIETLDRLMVSHGLERVDCFFNDRIGLHLNKIGWTLSATNLSSYRVLRFGMRWLARLISIGLGPFETTNCRGAAYTAIYKKKRADHIRSGSTLKGMIDL